MVWLVSLDENPESAGGPVRVGSANLANRRYMTIGVDGVRNCRSNGYCTVRIFDPAIASAVFSVTIHIWETVSRSTGGRHDTPAASAIQGKTPTCCQALFLFHNTRYPHSGLGLFTSDNVHYGLT